MAHASKYMRDGLQNSLTGALITDPRKEYWVYQHDFNKLIDLSAKGLGTSGAQYDPDWVYSGVDVTSGFATEDSDGGVVLDGSSGSGATLFIKPRTRAGVSVIDGKKFGTGEGSFFSFLFETGAALPSAAQFGLALTNAIDTTTDANPAKFYYDGTALTLQLSVSGTDYSYDLDTTLAASTLYRFELALTDDRRAIAAVNGVVKTNETAQLTDSIDLIPVVGLSAGAGGSAADLVFQPRQIRIGKALS